MAAKHHHIVPHLSYSHTTNEGKVYEIQTFAPYGGFPGEIRIIEYTSGKLINIITIESLLPVE